MLKLIIRVGLISLIPSFCFAPFSGTIVNWMFQPEHSESNPYITYGLWIVGTISIFLFNILAQKRQSGLNNLIENRNQLAGNSLNDILTSTSKTCDFDFNIFNCRLFKAKNEWLIPISKTTSLINLHIPDVTNKIQKSTRLIFKVKENRIEGVVGKAFHSGKFFYDHQMGDQNNYTLTEEQKNIIGDVNFCVALPIIRKGKITHIISLDSAQSLELDKVQSKDFELLIRSISVLFDQYVLI